MNEFGLSEWTVLGERMNRGIEWLDDTVPDWADKIDLDNFVFFYPDKCVLGQVFAGEAQVYELSDSRESDFGSDSWNQTGYGMVCNLFGTQWAVDHGFGGANAAIFRELWLGVIKERQAA